MRWYAYRIFRAIFKLFFKIFFRIKVHGAKNIPARGGFILASNHTSFLDPIAVGIACPRPAHFLARDDLFSNKSLGLLLRAWRVIPLNRTGQDIGAIKEAIRYIKEGSGVTIFPEGTRSPDGSIGELKLGVGLLAAKTRATIVPVLVKGSDKALPRNAKFIKPHTIEIFFGAPVSFAEFTGFEENSRELYSQINKKILQGLAKLSLKSNI